MPSTCAYRDLSRLFEDRYLLDHTAFHRRLMRADSYAGPVCTVDIARNGGAIFDNASDEFMYQMGMGAAVSAALNK